VYVERIVEREVIREVKVGISEEEMKVYIRMYIYMCVGKRSKGSRRE
jgi:hypothetical protein